MSHTRASFVFVLLATRSLFSPEHAPAQLPAPAIQQIEEASRYTWAAHLDFQFGKSPRDQVKLPLIEFVTRLYEIDPQFNEKDALQLIRRAETAFTEKYRDRPSDDNDARTALATLVIDIALSAGQPGVGTVLRATPTLINVPVKSLRQFEDNAALNATNLPALMLTGARTFDEAYRLGTLTHAHRVASQANQNRLRAVLDNYLSHFSNNAKIADLPLELLEKSPDFGKSERLRSAFNLLDQKGRVQLDAVKQLKKGNESAAAALKEYKRELTRLAELIEKKKSFDAAEARELINHEFADARAAVFLTSKLVGIVDGNQGHALAVSGGAAIHIAESIAYRLAGSISTTVMTGNIVGSISAIASLFNGGPTPEEIILADLRNLRAELARFREEVHQRFDRIERILSEIHENLITNLGVLHREMGYLRAEVRDMHKFLVEVNFNINGLSSDTRNYHLDVSRRELVTLLDVAYNPNDAAVFRKEKLQEQLRDLRLWSTDFALQSIETGTSQELQDLGMNDPAFFEFVLPRLQSRPFHENVGLLAQIARKCDGGVDPRRFANPITWANSANAFVALATRTYPTSAAVASVMDVDAIMSAGRESRNSLRALALAKSDGTKSSVFTCLLKAYRARADRFAELVSERKATYEREKISGLDLWQVATQSPRLDEDGVRKGVLWVERISPSPRYVHSPEFQNIKPRISVSLLPPGKEFALAKYVPNEYLVASRLGLGEIKVGYGDVHYNITKDDPNDPQAKFHVSIEARLVGIESGGKLVPASELSENQLRFLKRLPKDPEERTANGPNGTHWTAVPIFRRGIDTKDAHFVLGLRPGYADAYYEYGLTWDLAYYWGLDPNDTTPKRLKESGKGWFENGSHELRNSFFERSVEGISNGDQESNGRFVRESVERELHRHRAALDRRLIAAVSGRDDPVLSRAAQHLTCARLLIEAFVAVSLPRSLGESDQLRQILYGEKRIYDADSIVSATKVLHGPALRMDMDERLTLLEQAITRHPEPEDHIAIQRASDRLAVLGKLYRTVSDE